MIRRSDTICFIPARGGSKGIKNKNLQKLKKKTLLEITIELALQSRKFKKIIVSSDSSKILNIASRYKEILVLKRSKKNSKDFSTTDEALVECLKEINLNFENIVILQVTSPLRRINTLKKFLDHCISRNIKTCCTVTKIDESISLDGTFYSPILKKIRRRQLRKKFMYENGLIYFVKKKFFLQRKKIYPDNNWSYFETNRYESIDINNYDDLIISRLIYKNSK